MCAKKKHSKSSDFLKYLKDELSMQERHELERSLEADPFEKEAMEGLEGIGPEKAEEDLLSLHASLNKRLSRRRRRAWYSIAATAASILLIGTIFFNIYDLNPDQKDSEALTEESFRDLGSDEILPEKAPETSQEKVPVEESVAESEPESAPAPETAPAPAPAPNKISEQVSKNASERVTIEVSEDAPVDAPVDAPELETLDVTAEHEEIIAVEAKPESLKKSLRTEKMAAPAAYEAEAASKGAMVSGIVLSSEDMEPLPGASITISGSNAGTQTDEEGRFTLPSEEKQTPVMASFIGMETGEYQLVQDSQNQLVLEPDPVMLDEVVVLAYGSESRTGVSSASDTKVLSEMEVAPSYTAAEPPDGYKAFRDYVEDNLLFPEEYIPGEREVVVLKFIISSTGSVTDIVPLRSPGESYTKEAMRLLQLGPPWNPARLNGVPMDEEVRIRIVFKK